VRSYKSSADGNSNLFRLVLENKSLSQGPTSKKKEMGEEKKPNGSADAILKKIHYKKALVEWLKVQALSSSPSMANKQTKTRWRKIIKLRAAIHCFHCENRKTLEKTKEAKPSKIWKTKNRRHKLQEPEMKQSTVPAVFPISRR
jgi:homospermidine synthase